MKVPSPMRLSAAIATAAIATVANAQELRPAYVPSWADAPSLRTIEARYDTSKSAIENGTALRQSVEALVAGDHLIVDPGVWSVEGLFYIDVIGTAQAPVRVEGRPGAVLTRSNAGQNAVNIGDDGGGGTRFLHLSGFEVRGGSYGIRLREVQDVWIDRCYVHDVAGVGIGANSADTDRLTITRCEVTGTNGIGEGIYLGANNGAVEARHAVIAMNHVHHTGGSQGDGIELKQGSYGCVIAENTVHDTPYPGILVYGTDGREQNRIDANVVWNTATNPFQIQGEAIVTNNLIFARNGPAFMSGPHQGDPTELVVIGNTFLAETGRAGFLRSWANEPGMALYNNVFYAREGTAVWVNGGLDGVQVGGNVHLGFTFGFPSGSFVDGAGLGDFVDVSWDGSRRDARPTGASLFGAAWVAPPAGIPEVEWDLTGAARPAPQGLIGSPRAGALQPGTYGRYVGPLADDAPRIRTRTPLRAGASGSGSGSVTVRMECTVPQSPGYMALKVAGDSLPGAQSTGGTLSSQAARVLQRGVTSANGQLLVSWPTSLLPPFAGDQVEFRGSVLDRNAPSGVRASRRMVITLQP